MPGAAQARAAVDPKRLATITAETALWGSTLVTIDGDDGQPLFVLTRWSLTRAFGDLAEVEAFLRRVGARA